MDNFILSIPKDKKIRMLKDALNEDRFDIFMNLSKLWLNLPLNKGGLETEIVEQIFKKYQRK